VAFSLRIFGNVVQEFIAKTQKGSLSAFAALATFRCLRYLVVGLINLNINSIYWKMQPLFLKTMWRDKYLRKSTYSRSEKGLKSEAFNGHTVTRVIRT
jgi:hypothetical protein